MTGKGALGVVSVLLGGLIAAAPHARARAPAGAAPSATLRRGIALYGKRDYWAASVPLERVVSGQTVDSAANRQRAGFFLGRTLYHLNLYAGALAYFDRIVSAGASHRYYDATLAWLVSLSRVLPEASGVLDKIGRYDPAALANPVNRRVRDELAYLLGRFAYSRGKFAEAIGLFKRVATTSKFYFQAKYYEAIANVRSLKAKPALAAFKQLLVTARSRPSQYTRTEIERYENLTILQMARLFYSTREFAVSLKYYARVSPGTPGWRDGVAEAAWAHHALGHYTRALASIHSFYAPFVATGVAVEPRLLEAYIYYKKCRYDRATAVTRRISVGTQPLRVELRRLVARFPDNTRFYEYVQTLRAKASAATTEGEAHVVAVLGEPRVAKLQRWVDRLDEELRIVHRSDKTWRSTALAAKVLQELTLQKALARADAGRQVRELVRRRYRDMRSYARDSLKVRFEVKEAKAYAAKGSPRTRGRNPDRAPLVIAGDHILSAINRGFGRSPSGGYHLLVGSKCPGAMNKAKPSAGRSYMGSTKTRFRFEDDTIDTELEDPSRISFNRTRFHSYSTIRIRKHFLGKMLRSVESL